VDKNLSVNQPSGPTPFTNTFHPTIEQGGIFYYANIPGPSLLTGPGGALCANEDETSAHQEFRLEGAEG
jgi:hypothetical protein